MIKLLFDKANIVTTLGLLAGLFSIIFTVLNDWELSILMMLLAITCDIFDGIVARRFRKKQDKLISEIGGQFDSLADLVHSGIAPGIFIYYYTGETILSAILLAIIVISCFLRLAYYNCVGLTDKGYFYGLPVFYSPLILAVVYIIVSFINHNILLYFYAIIVPVLHISSSLRIKKSNSGPVFYIFLTCLFIEILYYLFYII